MLIGIDEVGRGPLAGPLVVGAVGLVAPVEGLRDSKLLSAKARERLDAAIRASGALIGLGWVHISELNEVGLSRGLQLAAQRALGNLLRGSSRGSASSQPFRAGSLCDSGCTSLLVAPTAERSRGTASSSIIIDGTVNFLKGTQDEAAVTLLKKADQLVEEVSAASIVAKVARDAHMTRLAAKYPAYGFEKHMGYGTAAHLAALKEYGTTPEHRTFCRPVAASRSPVIPREATGTTAVGNRAEAVVMEHLQKHGHRILARNFKSKIAELDIVSEWRGEIFVTEVKYRWDGYAGGGLAAVTSDKLRHLCRGAELYLKTNRLEGKNLRLLAADVTADFRIKTIVEIS